MKSYTSIRERFEGLDVEQRLALFEPETLKGVRLFDDGREECVLKTSPGKREYRHRVLFVYYVYDQKCRLCGGRVYERELTGDHIQPRGMGGGNRDDRVQNLWPAHGAKCNARRGSRRIAEGECCPFCGHDVVIGTGDKECFKCNSRW